MYYVRNHKCITDASSGDRTFTAFAEPLSSGAVHALVGRDTAHVISTFVFRWQ